MNVEEGPVSLSDAATRSLSMIDAINEALHAKSDEIRAGLGRIDEYRKDLATKSDQLLTALDARAVQVDREFRELRQHIDAALSRYVTREVIDARLEPLNGMYRALIGIFAALILAAIMGGLVLYKVGGR